MTTIIKAKEGKTRSKNETITKYQIQLPLLDKME